MTLRETFDRIAVIRELFPRCAYCGFTIQGSRLGTWC
jgi:hypothetical protein